MYIVAWVTGDLDNGLDHWETAETLAEARKRYAEIVAQDDTYIASITAVVQSTDYTAVPPRAYTVTRIDEHWKK